MKVMNVAVVGAGIYGINHVNAYTWNPNTNLVAVCDLNKEITDRIAEQYNVKTYNDVNEMLDNEEIDAVSIATPDAFHMDPALAAIRHGKPILVEKPLAVLKISTVVVQDKLDSIFPNVFPLIVLFLIYWLIRKKKVGTGKIVIGIIAVSILLSFVGIF